MREKTFELDISNDIAHLKFCRGDALNTVIRPFWRAFDEAVREIDEGAKARVIVISSTGRHFSAGMDLSELADTNGPFAGHGGIDVARHQEHMVQWLYLMQGMLGRLNSARVPVLAAIQGGCIGGGLDLVSACDIRYCTEDAFFVLQEINIGIMADIGTYPRLCHLIPDGLVRELGFTGRRLPAREAKAAGLVNAVYPDQEAMLAAVMEIAAEIAAKSPVAISASKAVINYARDHTIADGLNQVALMQGTIHHGAESVKAIEALQAKRAADFDELRPKPRFW